jgi:tetratricopeptide (TPR) repeat protein
LPFANISSASHQGDHAWIGESIAETVREALGARGVEVFPREDVVGVYRELRLRPLTEMTGGSVVKIAHALDATQVVHGTFRLDPRKPSDPQDSIGRLTVRARIVTPRDLTRSPSLDEEGPLEDLASLEAHLAWRALAVLAPGLAPPENEFPSLRPPARLDAQETYIRGLLAESPEQQEKYFIQAANLDARFWRPAFRLGKIHFERKQYRDAVTWLARVDVSDMHYAEAQFSIGVAEFQAADYAAAQAAFEAAAARKPAAETFNNLGASESRRNSPHAIESFLKALNANETEPDYHFNAGYALWKAGQFEVAADRFRSVLDRNPNDQMATLLLGRCLQKQGLRKGVPGDARLSALERLKPAYEDVAARPANR